jgi:30S ribosomal protein S31
MGKGDIKTGKGKRTNGSYGNTRKRKKASSLVATSKAEKPVAEKKAPAKKVAAKAPAKKTTKKATTEE